MGVSYVSRASGPMTIDRMLPALETLTKYFILASGFRLVILTF
jgi:hypothetical protein